MSRRFRTLLFIFFVLVFVIGAPCLVLYAQGYRLNLPYESGKKLIVMTGGFFVKTSPKQASVYVNGKYYDQTDFIFGGKLVENLLPRQYQVEVKKPGYQTWEKKLEVREKEVTEASYITLFPNKIGFSPVEKEIGSVIISPDRQKVAIKQNTDIGWNLKLYDLSQNVTSKLADQNNFAGKNTVFNNWEWTDAKTLGMSVSDTNATTSYSIAVDKSPARLTKNTTASSTSTEALATNKGDGAAYYLKRDGYIYKKGLTGNLEKASEAKIDVAAGTNYRLWVFGDYIFVAAGDELRLAKSGSPAFNKIFDGLKGDLKISPDGRKIFYASDSEIWLFYLKDKTTQPIAAAGDKVFLVRFSEKISGCEWINPDYLIFISGNAVKTAETDNRDKVNIATLANLGDFDPGKQSDTAPELIWNDSQKTAYLFIGGTLYRSQPIQ